MFKKVKIKRTDTCLTFVLKRLGVYDKYKDLDGFEFAKNFKLEQIKSFDELNKGDIIIVKSNKDCYKKSICIIDESGRTFRDYILNSYHFLLFEGDAISDYDGSNDIGYSPLDYFDITNSKSYYYVIHNSDL